MVTKRYGLGGLKVCETGHHGVSMTACDGNERALQVFQAAAGFG
jgi:hypothetical protein